MSDTSYEVTYREIVGASGTLYPIEPIRFSFVPPRSRVEMVDWYLSMNVLLKRSPEDADALLDARNEYSEMESEG